MKLYFTAAAEINPEYSILFNQLAANIHKPFTDLIESISKQHAESIDWWVSSPASRNTLVSPLFNYCCCLALIQELISANKSFSEIITDSRAFKKILEDYLSLHGVNAKVTLARFSVKQHLKELVRPIYTFGIPLRQLLLFFIAWQTRPLRKPLPSDSLTLIDTFVIPGYIEKDRYYPGLLEPLMEKEKQRVWFVPCLQGFRPWQYLSVIKRLRKAERNFLLKDDFLKFGDYWCLRKHLLRIYKLSIKPSFFRGVDISPLVCEELISFRNISSAYVPLLNYFFAKRLKQSGIELRLVIDWFENQVVDRGWNAGFRGFFPDVATLGYQGFIASTHYLCMYPTEEEKKHRVIPHKILVTGHGLRQLAQRFCPTLDVKVAPAFRFQHVWRERNYYPMANRYTILVALPMMTNEAIYILKLLAHAANDTAGSVRFCIKPHPTASQSQIKESYGDGWLDRFEFVEGDFNDCVEKSAMLICSGASSTCMETLAKGIPVIVVGNYYSLTHNPIPETITDDIWCLCYTPEEVLKAIQFYRSRGQEKIEEHEKVGKRIREEYFEPVTRENVMDLLEIANT